MTQALLLFEKAMDDLDLCDKILNDPRQHDNTGYHLAQACEKMFKTLCELNAIEYPARGHDSDDLAKLHDALESRKILSSYAGNFYEGLIKLSLYAQQARYEYTDPEERLGLKFYRDKLRRLQVLVCMEFEKYR